MGTATSRGADELWLETLQRVCGRAAHEIRGALNGVSVNLEVVRSRTAKPDTPAAAVSSFAASAAEQLEQLTRMTEALLLLGRAPREPVEVGATLANLVAVLAPAARADGTSLVVEGSADGAPGAVNVHGNVLRLVLAAALLAVLERKCDVRCVTEMSDVATVTIMCSDGGGVELSPDVLDAALGAGIEIQPVRSGISLAFPRAGRRTPGRE
jgi:hypothetical protein